MYQSKLHSEAADHLFDAILSLESMEECYRFFEDLCTVTELQALSQRILEQDGAADYLRFLSLGSRVPPLEALRVAGVDLATPAPVQQALALFAQRVEQLDKLL